MQAVVHGHTVLAGMLELIGRVDLDAEGNGLARRAVRPPGVAAPAAGGRTPLQVPAHLLRIVLEDDDARDQVGKLVGDQRALQDARTAWEFKIGRASCRERVCQYV